MKRDGRKYRSNGLRKQMALVMAGGLSASIVASLAFSISSPLRSRVNWKNDLCVPKTLSELMT